MPPAYAAVAYIRAASRAGVPVRQICQDLDERLGGHPALPSMHWEPID